MDYFFFSLTNELARLVVSLCMCVLVLAISEDDDALPSSSSSIVHIFFAQTDINILGSKLGVQKPVGWSRKKTDLSLRFSM